MNSQMLSYDRMSYSLQTNTEVLQAPAGKQLLVHSVSGINNTASAMGVGIAKMFNTDSAKVYENTTTPVLSSNPRNPVMAAGLVIATPQRTELICYDSSTGTATLEYWNGSAWTALTPLQAGATFVRYNAPVQWVAGSSYGSLDSALYYLRVAGLTAAADIKVCKFFEYLDSVASNQLAEVSFSEDQFLMEGSEAIIPFFETADANNVVKIAYRINP